MLSSGEVKTKTYDQDENLIPVNPLFVEFKLTHFTIPQLLKIQLLIIDLLDFEAEDIVCVSPPILYFYNTFFERLAENALDETHSGPAFEALKKEVVEGLERIKTEGYEYNYDHLWGYLLRKSFKRTQLFVLDTIPIFIIFSVFREEIIKLIETDWYQVKKLKEKKEKPDKKLESFYVEKKYHSIIKKSLKSLLGQLIKSGFSYVAQGIHQFFYISIRVYKENNMDKEKLLNLIANALIEGLGLKGKLFSYPKHTRKGTFFEGNELSTCERMVSRILFKVALNRKLFAKPFESSRYAMYSQKSYKRRLTKTEGLSMKEFAKLHPYLKPIKIQTVSLNKKSINKKIEKESEQGHELNQKMSTLSISHQGSPSYTPSYPRGQSLIVPHTSREEPSEPKKKIEKFLSFRILRKGGGN